MVEAERDRPAAAERGDVAGNPGRAPPPREAPPPPPRDERRKRGKGKAASGSWGRGEARRQGRRGDGGQEAARAGVASGPPSLVACPLPLSLSLSVFAIAEEEKRKRKERGEKKGKNKRRGLHVGPTSFLFYWVGCHVNETRDQYCHETKIVRFYIV